MIEIRDLCHVYDESAGSPIEALKGINLKIEKGEFVALIGPNGSGKSTLAKHLNALLLPTSGEVWVEGLNTKDTKSLWEIRRRVGMVFQNPDSQLVATTVEEEVAFGPENLGVQPEEIKRRVEEALLAVGMGKYRDSPPHLLSGGQKQRLAIAGILAMHPDYLILDEPTAMLDPRGRFEVMQTIRRLNRKEGVSIIHISQNMEEAVEAHRILVMDKGSIVLDDSPGEVFSQVDFLSGIRLEAPAIPVLAAQLLSEGFPFQRGILTVEEMVEEIVRLRGGQMA